jgi:hypothetical protein
MSSQEETNQKASQDIDWELIQEEDEPDTELTKMGIDTVKRNIKVKDTSKEDKEVGGQSAESDERIVDTVRGNAKVMDIPKGDSVDQDMTSKESNKLGMPVKEVQTNVVNGSAEMLNVWENQASNLQAVMEKDQEMEMDGWSKWQDVRQSKRIRDNGAFQQKMGDQAPSKTLQDMEPEGTLTVHQNSFAVLSNPQIIDLATKMGIHSESKSLEKINLLKDLENARMRLNEQSSADQNINLEEVNLPLEEQNILEWGLKNLMKNLLF